MQFVVRRARRAMHLLGALCCALVLFQAGPAEARRVALVIGNADYKVGPLQNPLNDAIAVAKAFEALQFDKVILRSNLGLEGFRAALTEMSRESAGAELGVVYFAGHGVEVAGRNYLIPTDAVLAKSGDLDLQAIALDILLNQLAEVTRLKLVILDACRTSVFPIAGAKRSVQRGLARIEPEDNTLVVYAAKDGTTADDGAGRKHSPFTEALLRHIGTPGLEVRLLFGQVRDDVMELTRHEAQPQQPHVYATLGGSAHYLLEGAPGGASPEATLLRERERELSNARAAAKAEAEKRKAAERAAEEARTAAAKATEQAKQRPAPVPPSRDSASSLTRTCTQERPVCVRRCGTESSPAKCDDICAKRHADCLRTGVFFRIYGSSVTGLARR